MSSHHTDAIKNFPYPTKTVELQRFLGLTNYFRKFIENYALVAKLLHNLLRKSVDFIFSDDCRQAFDSLKSALTSYPVLRIYNSNAETQLHTDASSLALAAILL